MTPTILNRRAKFNYFILESYEAGISLAGHEVKSIREGKVNLNEAFVRIIRGEAFLMNCHINPYSRIQGHIEIDPMRARKLLLNRSQIDRLEGPSSQKGMAIVPLKIYFKKGYAKVEIALGRGKKLFDKRESIKQRMHERETAAAIKSKSRKSR